MTYQILHLCARTTSHPVQVDRLRQSIVGFTKWDDLLQQAEVHGLGPLMYWHLKVVNAPLPNDFNRALGLLFLRHRRANTIRMNALGEVLIILDKEGIDVLVLKGAALCHLVYPEIGLRPMRDIDLLVRPSDAPLAQGLLIKHGYCASRATMPPDHYNQVSLQRTIDGLSMCIEAHHGIFPSSSPPYCWSKSFDQLFASAISFEVNGFSTRTLGYEDMLWHLYQHGFGMPLIYEPCRLIPAADIISLVEAKIDIIDWEKIQSEYSKLLAVLPLFHHLTPWHEAALSQLSLNPGPRPRNVGVPFLGWPRFRLSELKNKKLIEIFRSTFFPPEWWFKVYYGISGKMDWYRHRFGTHPLHILWWIRLYGSFFREFHLEAAGEGNWNKNGSLASKIRHTKIVVAGMIRRRYG